MFLLAVDTDQEGVTLLAPLTRRLERHPAMLREKRVTEAILTDPGFRGRT